MRGSGFGYVKPSLVAYSFSRFEFTVSYTVGGLSSFST
jgi:hypothetical protein